MRITVRLSYLSLLVCVLAMGARAFGWSNKEHILLTQLAVEGLLADESVPGEMPDMMTMIERPEVKVGPFGVGEGKLHYLDVELFNRDPANRVYRHDLSGRPEVGDFPRDLNDERYKQAGMLPFRVADCYERLVKAIREGRLVDRPGQFPRDEHATKWAGYLAHYAEDNTQPHHATLDYKSASYFANARTAPNVHNEMEYKMVDDDREDFMALREEYWAALVKALDEFGDPVTTNDAWQATLEVCLKSYEALPLIGQAGMVAAKQGGTAEKPEGPNGAIDTVAFFHFKGACFGGEMSVLEMKARQQAWAVKRTQRLWLQAWREAMAGRPGQQ